MNDRFTHEQWHSLKPIEFLQWFEMLTLKCTYTDCVMWYLMYLSHVQNTQILLQHSMNSTITLSSFPEKHIVNHSNWLVYHLPHVHPFHKTTGSTDQSFKTSSWTSFIWIGLIIHQPESFDHCEGKDSSPKLMGLGIFGQIVAAHLGSRILRQTQSIVQKS